jgi:hypothetical protein
MTNDAEAQRLHDADPWPVLNGREHPKWDDCNEEHMQRYRNYVAWKESQ